MTKKVLTYLIGGIAWGCCWFVVTGIIFHLIGMEEARIIIFNNFTQQALGSILVGIACSSTTIVYTFERLKFWQQIGIHYGVGLGVFFPVAFHLQWFPSDSIGIILGFVLYGTFAFFLIWLGFYLYHKRQADKINDRLKELDQE